MPLITIDSEDLSFSVKIRCHYRAKFCFKRSDWKSKILIWHLFMKWQQSVIKTKTHTHTHTKKMFIIPLG